MGCPRDVQVAIDDDLSAKADVPVGGPGRTAPLCKFWKSKRLGWLADEWPVTNQNRPTSAPKASSRSSVSFNLALHHDSRSG